MTTPLSIRLTLGEYLDNEVAVTLTGVAGMMVTGRLYGVTYDRDERPSMLVLRDDQETPIVIPWHAVAVVQHVGQLQAMIDAANAAANAGPHGGERPPG
jgi:hypothetical protein